MGNKFNAEQKIPKGKPKIYGSERGIIDVDIETLKI